MNENTAFNYFLLGPVALCLIAVWIVVGSIGERIARRHAATRSTRECPQCQAEFQAMRQSIRNRIVALLCLVDVARYACGQCGFRQSVWKPRC